MTEDSLPFALFNRVLNQITTDFQLHEIASENGSLPFLPIDSQSPVFDGRVGEMRRYSGRDLFQVVTISIVVPPIQLDSHMLFAFTPSSSDIPHFTVDSVHAGGTFAFHLDLIPRVDIGANLDYIEKVYDPLTDIFDRTNALEGLTEPKLTPKQRAIMSPWMLAARASETAFSNIQTAVDDYYTHWKGLAKMKNIQVETTPHTLVARDQKNKSMLFNPAIDPVWQQITPLVGNDVALHLLETLKLCDE